jgi:acetyltransferase-like isoleucine patch superfamily enzyme
MNQADIDMVAEIVRHLASIPAIDGDLERLTVGENVNLGNTRFNTNCGTITIGDRTKFSPDCSVLTGSHDFTEGFPRSADGRDIVIGKDCWIASRAMILGPCNIGDRCVIAAGAVVTKDCEAGWVYGGVPAKKIKRWR